MRSESVVSRTLRHYSGQQFERGAVSVSESLVSCALKADSGKKRQLIRGFRNIHADSCGGGLSLPGPWEIF